MQACGSPKAQPASDKSHIHVMHVVVCVCIYTYVAMMLQKKKLFDTNVICHNLNQKRLSK